MTQFVVLPLAEVEKQFPVNPQTGSRMKITSPGHAIDPIALESGTEFILPLEVLDDQKHADALEFAKTNPGKEIDLKDPVLQREVAESEFKKPEEDKPAEIEFKP